MHKGKFYPYNPIFWATESWFYPGWLPWKCSAVNLGLWAPPWDQIGLGVLGISDPAVTVPDASQISYHWTLTGSSSATDLEVSMEQIRVSGVDYARYKAVATGGPGGTASAWLYTAKPRRIVTTLGEPWNIVNAVDPQPGQIQLWIQPATYAEGGSPW
jgi:hypothetical protein